MGQTVKGYTIPINGDEALIKAILNRFYELGFVWAAKPKEKYPFQFGKGYSCDRHGTLKYTIQDTPSEGFKMITFADLFGKRVKDFSDVAVQARREKEARTSEEEG